MTPRWPWSRSSRSASETPSSGPRLDLVEEVDIPGWIYMPDNVDEAGRESWISQVTGPVLGLINDPKHDTPRSSESEVRDILLAGLVESAARKGSLLYQVWPIASAAALFCEVSVCRTADLPDLNASPSQCHPAQARRIGPGLQYTSNRPATGDAPGRTDLGKVSAVHFIFVDAHYAVTLNLLEAPAELIPPALTLLGLYKSALAGTYRDGSRFRSVPPPMLHQNA